MAYPEELDDEDRVVPWLEPRPVGAFVGDQVLVPPPRVKPMQETWDLIQEHWREAHHDPPPACKR